MREWFGISVQFFSNVIASNVSGGVPWLRSRRQVEKKNPRQPCQRGFPNNFRNDPGKTLA
jgi:hypothetical protein